MTEEGKFDILDLDGWIIQKKFVQIGSSNYTDEALSFIKEKVDEERAIMFDRDTHRIYTLGDYYGGDTLKENLMFFSKILAVNIGEEEINEIVASGPDSTLEIQGSNGITIRTAKEEGKDVIQIFNNLQKIVNEHTIVRRDGSIYRLFINEDSQIDIEEYSKPEFSLEFDYLEYDESGDDDYYTTVIPYKIFNNSIKLDKWESFEMYGIDCELVTFTEKYVELTFKKGENGKLQIDYNDGVTSEIIEIDITWSQFAYYGVYDGLSEYIEEGKWPLGEIESTFIVDQGMLDYAYLMIPISYDILILDDLTYMQGAWQKKKGTIIKNNSEYNTYITSNSGLGKVRWKIIKNIK